MKCARIAALLLACACLACPARAGGIVPLVRQPAAARGGVLAVPLQAAPGTRWPDTLSLQRTDGGQAIEGVVAWIGEAEPSVARAWTQADESLDVRPASRAQEGGAVLLLAKVPADVRGSLRLDGESIEPTWFELATPEPDAGRAMLAPSATPGMDQPDPSAPAEWFRWWLLADASGTRPPAPTGDTASQLFALHRAQLWQAGLDRVERLSPGVATELRERLTAVSTEMRGAVQARVASWIAESDSLSTLLGVLVDATRSDQQVVETALTWLRAQSPLTCWIESDDGASVRVVALNASGEEALVRLAWLESPAMPALALRVPAHGIGRQSVDRPPELMPDVFTRNASPLRGTLLLQWNDWKRRMAVGPARFTPRPPGFPLGVLLPSMRLADAQRGAVVAPPEAWRTTASLRKRFGRWEVFAECLRPTTTELDELEVMVGEGTRIARIRVREHGEPVIDGAGELPPPVITRGSFTDRWRCVIELPEAWCAASPPASVKGAKRITATPLRLGVARSPGGVGTRQSAVLAVPPWAAIPVLSLDPSGWWSGARPAVAAESPVP